MARIPKDELTQLISASQAKSIASSALDDAEMEAVAYAINSAVNTGEYRVEYGRRLRPATIEALNSNGYTVNDAGYSAHSAGPILITW